MPLKIDWFDLLAVQRTLKNLLQHLSSKASILSHSVFFAIQLSQPYMTAGKTTAVITWTFVGKVVSLLSNILSKFVTVFLPRSNRLLISWLQSPSTVIFKAKKRKEICHYFSFIPSICHESMGPDPYLSLIFTFKLVLSLSSFALIKKLFSSSLLSAIRVVSSTYLRLLMFLPHILIPACNSSNLVFLMMCSAYRLSKVTEDSTIFFLSQT